MEEKDAKLKRSKFKRMAMAHQLHMNLKFFRFNALIPQVRDF